MEYDIAVEVEEQTVLLTTVEKYGHNEGKEK